MVICMFCVQTIQEISPLTAKGEEKKSLRGLHKSGTITGGPIPSYFVPDTRDPFFNQTHSS